MAYMTPVQGLHDWQAREPVKPVARPLGAQPTAPADAMSRWADNPWARKAMTAPGFQPPVTNLSTPPQNWNDLYNRFQTGQVGQHDVLRLGSLILSGQGQGMFSPYGDPEVSRIAARNAEETGRAHERRAVLGAQLDSGGDPALGAYAKLQARLGTGQETQRAVSEARMQQLQQAQAIRQWLLQQFIAYNLDLGRGEQQGIWNRRAADAAGGGSGIPQMAGQILGSAAGGFLGNPGLLK